jgi:hypothetical protein
MLSFRTPGSETKSGTREIIVHHIQERCLILGIERRFIDNSSLDQIGFEQGISHFVVFAQAFVQLASRRAAKYKGSSLHLTEASVLHQFAKHMHQSKAASIYRECTTLPRQHLVKITDEVLQSQTA